MTLDAFLNAYANRHGKVIIKDEYNNPVVSGDGWAFVIEHAEYMKYEELHAREVECFSFSDGILYVYLAKLPDPGGVNKYKRENNISSLNGLWIAYKKDGVEAIMHGKVIREVDKWLSIKKSRKHHYEDIIHVGSIIGIFNSKNECYECK